MSSASRACEASVSNLQLLEPGGELFCFLRGDALFCFVVSVQHVFANAGLAKLAGRFPGVVVPSPGLAVELLRR